MLEFLVSYVIHKSSLARVIIRAKDLTEAYITFLMKFPDYCEITDIMLNCPVKA